MPRLFAGTAAVLFVLVLAGCQPEIDRGATAKPAAAKEPESQSHTVVSGSGSALGKARDAAGRTVEKSDAYQRKLEREIEKINE
ncbi:MAG: hypothetical protein KDA22_11775 [Phycisphaerales bacterium]|nr:hypothetical protein [Phycisphaerales bacterium]